MSRRQWLTAIFALSGAGGLIYQVVWQRLLTLHYGVGAVSAAVIVSVYMMGLGLGGALGGLACSRPSTGAAAPGEAPLRAYMWVEAALGVFGALSLPLLSAIGEATAGADLGVAVLCMAGFLLVPTTLMGATLPLMVEALGSRGGLADGVGRLYFANTLGAAVGALVASYGLISFVGLDRTLYVAVAINATLTLAVAVLSARPARPPDAACAAEVAQAGSPLTGGLGRASWALVFVSGAVAIGLEIVWLRLIGVLVKASPYAFSSVIALYLLGIAVGSEGLRRWLASRRAPVDGVGLFCGLQAAVGVSTCGIVAAYHHLSEATAVGLLTDLSFAVRVHPWPAVPDLSQAVGWARLWASVDLFFWPFVFLAVPTALMGASFPLISHLAKRQGQADGQAVGGVYFFNTLGNLVGGLVSAFVLLPALGTGGTLLLLCLVSTGFVLVKSPLGAPGLTVRALGAAAIGLSLIAIMPSSAALYAGMHPDPEGLATRVDEGVEGVVLSQGDGDTLKTWIGGLGHGGRPGTPFYCRAIEALDRAPAVSRVLIIGVGTASFVEAALATPGVERVTLIELNRSVVTHLRRFEALRAPLADPRLDIVYDDGRRYLLREAQPYDVILIDPLRSTTSHSNNLYSRELMALVRAHLRPQGLFFIWMDEAAVLPRTVATVFDAVDLYEGFALASLAPLPPSQGRRPRIVAGLPEGARAEALACRPTPLGDRAWVLAQTEGLPINEDWRPRCEYYLGLPAAARALDLYAPAPQGGKGEASQGSAEAPTLR